MRAGRGTIALLALACVAALAGCSQGEEQGSLSAAEVDRRAVALPEGAPVEAVRAELGEPLAEFVDASGEGSLNYPRWQFAFADGELVRKSRRIAFDREGGLPGSAGFDAAVLALRPGMTVAAVRNRLGRPELVEDVWEDGPGPRRVLAYGGWELKFRDGRLEMRTG